MLTSVLRVCNSFNHFFITNKVKHSRRCDICLDKTNILKIAIDVTTDVVQIVLNLCRL